MNIMFDKWFDWFIEAPLVIQLLPLFIAIGMSFLLNRDWRSPLFVIAFSLLVYLVVRFM